MARRPRLLDVADVVELQAELTGRRVAPGTIRSYHSRGYMPAQVEPGRWKEADIRRWLATWRPRPRHHDRVSAKQLQATAKRLAKAAEARRATGGSWTRLDQEIAAARELGMTWEQIGWHVGVSPQAAWAGYRRRNATLRRP